VFRPFGTQVTFHNGKALVRRAYAPVGGDWGLVQLHSLHFQGSSKHRMQRHAAAWAASFTQQVAPAAASSLKASDNASG
jgi:hypothetical protein